MQEDFAVHSTIRLLDPPWKCELFFLFIILYGVLVRKSSLFRMCVIYWITFYYITCFSFLICMYGKMVKNLTPMVPWEVYIDHFCTSCSLIGPIHYQIDCATARCASLHCAIAFPKYFIKFSSNISYSDSRIPFFFLFEGGPKYCKWYLRISINLWTYTWSFKIWKSNCRPNTRNFGNGRNFRPIAFPLHKKFQTCSKLVKHLRKASNTHLCIRIAH